jgi:hypothetical protein
LIAKARAAAATPTAATATAATETSTATTAAAETSTAATAAAETSTAATAAAETPTAATATNEAAATATAAAETSTAAAADCDRRWRHRDGFDHRLNDDWLNFNDRLDEDRLRISHWNATAAALSEGCRGESDGQRRSASRQNSAMERHVTPHSSTFVPSRRP